jgi:hypothetical protein
MVPPCRGYCCLFRHTVFVDIQKQVRNGTEESVRAFESVQKTARTPAFPHGGVACPESDGGWLDCGNDN